MHRRSFLGALAILPLVTALAGTRLPKLEEEPESTVYWISNQDFYSYDGQLHTLSNALSRPCDLTEQSLEELCESIRKLAHGPYRLEPTRRIVSPAEYAWMHRSWFERLFDRVF
jgi:hypothetical protein